MLRKDTVIASAYKALINMRKFAFINIVGYDKDAQRVTFAHQVDNFRVKTIPTRSKHESTIIDVFDGTMLIGEETTLDISKATAMNIVSSVLAVAMPEGQAEKMVAAYINDRDKVASLNKLLHEANGKFGYIRGVILNGDKRISKLVFQDPELPESTQMYVSDFITQTTGTIGSLVNAIFKPTTHKYAAPAAKKVEEEAPIVAEDSVLLNSVLENTVTAEATKKPRAKKAKKAADSAEANMQQQQQQQQEQAPSME